MNVVHVEYMDYVYGASRVLTVFISVAGPYEGGRPVDPLISLELASFIETGAFYYCTRVGRYRNSFWLVRSLRPAGVSREQDFVFVIHCHSSASSCSDSDSVEMSESPLMREGWAVLQLTLTAQPSRSSQRTGPAFLLFLPALRALDFGPVLVVMLRMATLVVWLCVWFVWLQ